MTEVIVGDNLVMIDYLPPPKKRHDPMILVRNQDASMMDRSKRHLPDLSVRCSLKHLVQPPIISLFKFLAATTPLTLLLSTSQLTLYTIITMASLQAQKRVLRKSMTEVLRELSAANIEEQCNEL